MNKIKIVVAVALVAAAALLYHNYKVASLKHALVQERFARDSVITLSDSTKAALASSEVNGDSLAFALQAAEELNGRLVAATRIRLQTNRVVRDTVSGVQTEKDSTRLLAVRDTTEAGVLAADVEAPPYPAKIIFGYTFTPAPIDATVSLVQMSDNSAVFAVRYRGGETTIVAPYAKLPSRERTLVPYVEGLYSPIVPTNFAARVGAQLKLPLIRGMYGVAEAQQLFGNVDAGSVYVGVRKVF